MKVFVQIGRFECKKVVLKHSVLLSGWFSLVEGSVT